MGEAHGKPGALHRAIDYRTFGVLIIISYKIGVTVASYCAMSTTPKLAD
jgi:hypothetical protein